MIEVSCLRVDDAEVTEVRWVTGPCGEVIHFNPGALDFFGLTTEAATGWHWQWVVHPSDLARLRRLWNGALGGCEPCSAKVRLRRSDGTYCWRVLSASPMCDDSGRIRHWIMTCDAADRAVARPELELAGTS